MPNIPATRARREAAIYENSRLIRRMPIVPTLLVLAAVGVMIGLGLWQLDRLRQKEALIARYQAAQADPGYSFIWPYLPEAAYTRVQAYCNDPSRWTAVAGRNARGEAGWAHVVRCTIGGYEPDIPPEMRSPDFVLHSADIVIGWSRAPQPVKWIGGKVSGTVVPTGELGFKIVTDPPLAGLQANAKPDPRDIPNNHLAYAIQWFFFAGTALVIYALALWRRWQGKDLD
ncbi:MAG: SURF1 family protein [Novosphingobium sp.]